MLNCSNCNKELDRIVFCGSKCKMQYHRKNVTKGNDNVTKSNVVERIVTNSNVPKKKNRKINKNGLCDHFIAESGYCRKCYE